MILRPPSLILLVLGFLCQAPNLCDATETFTNPVIANGADPWLAYRDGYYYLTYTTGSSVIVYRSTRLAGTNGLGHAQLSAIFYPPPPFNQDVWAPELHFINGKAYVYYAADDGNNANHRMFAAASDKTGPSFSFAFKGKVYDPSSDRWAIDGTVLESTNGLYFIWSGWPGTQNGLQNLYIAPMSDPLTISGARVLLATPNPAWESWIEEGPEVLQKDGRVFIVYAANQSWTDNECLGMLVNLDGNYLSPASWSKSSGPVFDTYVSTNGAVYGPGHCGFTKSLDGTQDWIVYHAAKSMGSGWDRNIRMQSFQWDSRGYPSFGHPLPAGPPLTIPSGDAFTPARFNTIQPNGNGSIHLNITAPLPLVTNQWILESTTDLNNWNTITNLPGLQYSLDYVDAPTETNRFFRVESKR